jgi:hypothetical protein
MQELDLYRRQAREAFESAQEALGLDQQPSNTATSSAADAQETSGTYGYVRGRTWSAAELIAGEWVAIA